MRAKTPDDRIYDWHSRTMAHIAVHGEADRRRPQVSEAEPQCGWYRRRLVPKGPFVPARIWLEQPYDEATGELTGPEVLRCEVDGRRRDVALEWTWLCGHPITEDDYMDMMAKAFALPSPEPVGQPETRRAEPVAAQAAETRPAAPAARGGTEF